MNVTRWICPAHGDVVCPLLGPSGRVCPTCGDRLFKLWDGPPSSPDDVWDPDTVALGLDP